MSEETIQLIITSVVAPVILCVVKVVTDKLGKNVKNDGEDKGNLSPPSLTDHIFFERMEYLDNHIQYFFSIPNKGKERVFKDIISVTIREHINQMLLLTEKDLHNLSDLQLYQLVSQHLDLAVASSNSFYYSNKYTIDEQRVLEIVMSKFNRWHRGRVEQTYRSVERVCNSKFYGSPEVKVSVILDLLLGSFIDTVNDAESTLNELNGDLKGLVYKNIQL